MIIILMGVSGCGKTTVGIQVAKQIPNCQFYDGDSYHSEENKRKMADGFPLSGALCFP